MYCSLNRETSHGLQMPHRTLSDDDSVPLSFPCEVIFLLLPISPAPDKLLPALLPPLVCAIALTKTEEQLQLTIQLSLGLPGLRNL